MTLYALVKDDQVVQTGTLPRTYHDGTRWWDLRDNETEAALAGWFPVVETERPADTETTIHDTWKVEMVAGKPTREWVSRLKTEAERAAEAEQNARLDDLTARVARLEALVQPAPPAPTTPTDPTVKTFAEWGGVWPNGQLLREGETVYRNVSGVPLTTAPSAFPGGPSAWTHMFVVVLAPEPEPDPDPTHPAGYVGAWNKDTSYKVGDVVDRNGRYYKCLVAHGAEYQGTWGPPQGSVWTDLGPVA